MIILGECKVSGRTKYDPSIYTDVNRYWEWIATSNAFDLRERGLILRAIPNPDASMRWHYLCLPHPTPGYWRLSEAARAADAFVADVPQGTIVCIGTRVARALTGAFKRRRIATEYPKAYGEVQLIRPGLYWTRLPNVWCLNPMVLDRARARLS